MIISVSYTLIWKNHTAPFGRSLLPEDHRPPARAARATPAAAVGNGRAAGAALSAGCVLWRHLLSSGGAAGGWRLEGNRGGIEGIVRSV